LLAVNALKLGQRGGAVIGFVMGVILTYSLLGLVGYVGRFVTPWVLVPAGAGIMWWVAGMLQGDLLDAHRKSGGRSIGVPVALGVGVLTAGLLFLAIKPFVVVRPAGQQQAAQPGEPGQQVVRPLELAVGEKQVVKYFPPVTEDEGRRVGQVLLAAGYFDKTGRVAREVMMGRERTVGGGGGQLVMMFPVPPGKENEPDVLKGFAMVAQGLVRNGVGLPFVIRLMGPDGKVLRDIRADVGATRPVGGDGGQVPTTNPAR
jgi:hypothetical protein